MNGERRALMAAWGGEVGGKGDVGVGGVGQTVAKREGEKLCLLQTYVKQTSSVFT